MRLRLSHSNKLEKKTIFLEHRMIFTHPKVIQIQPPKWELVHKK